jgi:hypothetical protein
MKAILALRFILVMVGPLAADDGDVVMPGNETPVRIRV